MYVTQLWKTRQNTLGISLISVEIQGSIPVLTYTLSLLFDFAAQSSTVS